MKNTDLGDFQIWTRLETNTYIVITNLRYDIQDLKLFVSNVTF